MGGCHEPLKQRSHLGEDSWAKHFAVSRYPFMLGLFISSNLKILKLYDSKIKASRSVATHR